MLYNKLNQCRVTMLLNNYKIGGLMPKSSYYDQYEEYDYEYLRNDRDYKKHKLKKYKNHYDKNYDDRKK